MRKLSLATVIAFWLGAVPTWAVPPLPPRGGGDDRRLEAIVVNGSCTLGDAIEAANLDSPVGGCTAGDGADTLILDVDVELVAADPGSTALAGTQAGLPDISSPIRIEAGLGTTIERSEDFFCNAAEPTAFRLFNVVDDGALTLSGLTLRNGCATRGGGVLVFRGALTVIDSELSGHVARDDSPPGPTKSVRGGAIYFDGSGSLAVAGSLFADNLAIADSGTGWSAEGGAIYVLGSHLPSMTDTTLRRNQALGSLGGTLGGAGRGGALVVFAGNIGTIEDCLFEDNLARGGDGSSQASSASGGAVYLEALGGVLRRTIFRGNTARGGTSFGTAPGGLASGGALEAFCPCTLDGVVFERNSARGGDSGSGLGGAAFGGGLAHLSGSLQSVRFTGNRAEGGGGVSGGQARGGGAFLGFVNGSFEDVTFDRNLAQGGAAAEGDGGLARGGALETQGVSMANLTVSDNQALGGSSVSGTGGDALGGGLILRPAQIALHHATVAGNRAVAGAGTTHGAATGGGLRDESGLTVSNSIFAGNHAVPVPGGTPADDDCSTTAVTMSLGFNLVGAPGDCTFAATGDQLGADPELGPLGLYECTTLLPTGACLPTRRLELTSPALDQGSCATSGAVNDARNLPRPWDDPTVVNLDDGCDIGAYEARDENGNGVEDGREVFLDGFESGDTQAWSAAQP